MKSWAWAAVGLLVGAGMLGGAACGGGGNGTGGSTGSGGSGGSTATNPQTSTASTASGQGGTANCGSLPSQFTMPTPACGMCVSDKCCSEALACDTGTDCFNLLQCEVTMPTMQTQCEAQFTAGKAPLDALNTCISKDCGTANACGVMCMGNTIQFNDAATGMPDPMCNSCMNQFCCAEMGAISSDVSTSMDPNCAPGSANFGMCPPVADFFTCQGLPSDPVCATDTDAAKASKCDHDNCGDICDQPICDSGLVNKGTGFGKCADCLDQNCCSAFEASMCNDPAQATACNTWLTDLTACSNDMGMCNGDASAQAAFTCQTTTCMADCM